MSATGVEHSGQAPRRAGHSRGPRASSPPAEMGLRGHARRLLVLGLPLTGGHLAQFAIGLVDTLMLGRYSVQALAAQVLAGSYFFVIFIVGSGFALAVMPLVAAAAGRGDMVEARRVTRMGLWLSAFFFVVVQPLFLWSGPILRGLGQKPELAAPASAYLHIMGLALLPYLVVMVIKSHLAALERTQVVLWLSVAAALLNAALNWVLIFGHLGAPELGIRGAALASLATAGLTALVAALHARAAMPGLPLFARLWRPDPEIMARVFRLGVPIGATNLAETGLFAATAMMVGWLGAVPLAAHGIALQLASMTFMIHLGLSNAATIRAGNAFGRGDMVGLRRGAVVASGISALVAVVAIVAFLAVPETLIGLFLGREAAASGEILALGTTLLALAALFQLVDGAQVIALGLLRGIQDATMPMVYAAVSYWGLGISASWLLGFGLGLGAPGVWGGLVIGLAAAAVMLSVRFWRRVRADARFTSAPRAAGG